MSTNQTTQSTVSETVTPPTEIEKLTKELISAIEKKGLVHTFEWMHGWFDSVARAQVKDELNQYLGEHAKDHEAVNLYLAERVVRESASISNHSTSASSNLMRQSRLSAMAKILDSNHDAYVGSAHRRDQWDAWNEKVEAEKDAEMTGKKSLNAKNKP